MLGFTLAIYKTVLLKCSTSIVVDRGTSFNRSTQPTITVSLQGKITI